MIYIAFLQHPDLKKKKKKRSAYPPSQFSGQKGKQTLFLYLILVLNPHPHPHEYQNQGFFILLKWIEVLILKFQIHLGVVRNTKYLFWFVISLMNSVYCV